MASAFSFETPARLLQRVEQLEDMELPSLPSFQHDIDYESTSMSEADTSQEEVPAHISREKDEVSLIINLQSQRGLKLP
jgi:hypothetical protein